MAQREAARQRALTRNALASFRALVAAAMLLAGAAGPAQGQETAWIVWSCRLGNDRLFSLECKLDRAPAAATIDQRPGLPFDHNKYLGDLFAAGAARNIARLVRADHATYGGTLWRIPLYAPPIDDENVKLLALSVMCGRDARCVVGFENLIVAADCADWIRDARSPELQSAVESGRRAAACVQMN